MTTDDATPAATETTAETTDEPRRTSLDGFHRTAAAERRDRVVRRFFDAVNDADADAFRRVVDRGFLSYSRAGTRTATVALAYYATLRQGVPDLRYTVHENVGVLVEGDLVSVRTLLTGTHRGLLAGVEATGASLQTSVSHFFRIGADDRVREHWYVIDASRVFTSIGLLPGVADTPDGLRPEKPGTPFGQQRTGWPVSTELSRALAVRIFDGTINTGRPEDAGPIAEGYLQNSGWTPDGRSFFVDGWTAGRATMPDGRATVVLSVAEQDRSASFVVWDGTGPTGVAADFITADFLRSEDGEIAEHWDTVDWVSLSQVWGMAPSGLPLLD